MTAFIVTLNYQTDGGQPSSARVPVEAADEDSAYELARSRLVLDRRRRVLKIDGGDIMPA